MSEDEAQAVDLDAIQKEYDGIEAPCKHLASDVCPSCCLERGYLAADHIPALIARVRSLEAEVVHLRGQHVWDKEEIDRLRAASAGYDLLQEVGDIIGCPPGLNIVEYAKHMMTRSASMGAQARDDGDDEMKQAMIAYYDSRDRGESVEEAVRAALAARPPTPEER